MGHYRRGDFTLTKSLLTNIVVFILFGTRIMQLFSDGSVDHPQLWKCSGGRSVRHAVHWLHEIKVKIQGTPKIRA